jgi:N-acetylmuramoyl-L-alanine amidase
MNWKKLKAVDYIVIHCSATKEDQNFTVEDIRRWHRQKGWMDVGYHFVITRDGEVQKGRPHDVPGAHVRGFNHISLGICLVGGVESDGKTPESNYTAFQWKALESLVKDLRNLYPDATVLGHRDMPNVNKACPSFDVLEWWSKVGGQPQN